jgi:hypothetical protein
MRASGTIATRPHLVSNTVGLGARTRRWASILWRIHVAKRNIHGHFCVRHCRFVLLARPYLQKLEGDPPLRDPGIRTLLLLRHLRCSRHLARSDPATVVRPRAGRAARLTLEQSSYPLRTSEMHGITAPPGVSRTEGKHDTTVVGCSKLGRSTITLTMPPRRDFARLRTICHSVALPTTSNPPL